MVTSFSGEGSRSTRRQATCKLYHTWVFEHKEAISGKVCPVRISAPLIIDLKTYATIIPESTEPYLYLTHTGKFITP
jgi:hypothetical protein